LPKASPFNSNLSLQKKLSPVHSGSTFFGGEFERGKGRAGKKVEIKDLPLYVYVYW